MHAHFTGHVYHRHSHDTYSFGVTESGAQSFTCRQAGHTSTAGMVMAFNPDDPHDGHATTGAGFRYRMIHVGPGLVTDALSDIERPAGRPLFTRPVVDDPALARALRRLHRALTGQASPLERSERLSAAVALAARFAASGPPDPAALTGPDVARTAHRVREFLDGNYAAPVTGAELAAAAGRSRYAAYRAFHAVHGLAPSDYQRQLRLRAVRQWLAQGMPLAEGGRCRRLRRPGAPDPVVPPLLRHHPGRVRARRARTLARPAACPARAWPPTPVQGLAAHPSPAGAVHPHRATG